MRAELVLAEQDLVDLEGAVRASADRVAALRELVRGVIAAAEEGFVIGELKQIEQALTDLELTLRATSSQAASIAEKVRAAIAAAPASSLKDLEARVETLEQKAAV